MGQRQMLACLALLAADFAVQAQTKETACGDVWRSNECFETPMVMDTRVAECTGKNTGCGKEAATAFCKHNGWDRADRWQVEFARHTINAQGEECDSAERMAGGREKCAALKLVVCSGSSWMPNENWEGVWQERYGRARLEQNGRDVKGSYGAGNRCLVGIVQESGLVLTGKWHHAGCDEYKTKKNVRSGSFRFELTKPRHWDGHWTERGKGETKWSGDWIGPLEK